MGKFDKLAKALDVAGEDVVKLFSREALPKGIKLTGEHIPAEEFGKELAYNYRLDNLPEIHYAVKNNKVVGHVGLDDDGAVKTVFVDPKHRRQGVAEQMYKGIADKNGFIKSDEPMAMEPEAKSLWGKLKSENPKGVTQDKSGWTLKKLAGVSAAPAVNMGLDDSFKNFREDVAKPLVNGWEKVKSVVTDPLSKQLNLSKDPSVAGDLKQVLDIGLDPTNLLGGVPGVVAGGLQMMGSGDNKEEIAKRNALKKLQGEY